MLFRNANEGSAYTSDRYEHVGPGRSETQLERGRGYWIYSSPDRHDAETGERIVPLR